MAKNNFIEWDVKTITAGDYSIEIDLPEAMFDKYISTKWDATTGLSKVAGFRDFLKQEFEDRLSSLPDLGYEDVPVDVVKIAMITFAFDNAGLITMLRTRGSAIKNELYDDMRKSDKEINEYVQGNLKTIARPVTAFITFENEEGLNRALNYHEAVDKDPTKQDLKTLLGEELNIEAASEPTDIIWENRHFTQWDRVKRASIVIGVICVMLCISAVSIYYLTAYSTSLYYQYPIVACDGFYASFGNGAGTEEMGQDGTLLEKYAFQEWYNNYGLDMDSTNYIGYLQCFCDSEAYIFENGLLFNGDIYYYCDGTEDTSDLSLCETYPVDSTDDFEDSALMEFAICYDYSLDYYVSLTLGSSISVVIVVVNMIIRTINIDLIKYVGEDTHSAQLKSIANGVFVALFFNTGFIMLMVYANLTEFNENSIFQGWYYDFDSYWYSDVGYKLTQTMLINMVFPFIEFTMAYTQTALFRKMDRKWGKDDYITKQSSMQLYIDLYSGPEYMIHFKYSIILNVMYVTMMYGLGIPILFPIAAATYFVLYTVERLMVAYYYQLPPAFDDKLTKNAVAILKVSPILYLSFGYWMLSNKSIFQNYWEYIDTTTAQMGSGHTFATLTIDQALPVLIMFLAICVIVLFQTFFRKILKKWGFSFGSSKINVDENLPNFFKALKLNDADWMIKENENLRDNYGFSVMSNQTAEILDTIIPPKKAVTGVPYYMILANPKYFRDFNYICCDVPDRAELIKDDDDDEGNDMEQSDIVAVLLNIGFIPDLVVEKFSFEKGFQQRFKDAQVAQKIGIGALGKLGMKLVGLAQE